MTPAVRLEAVQPGCVSDDVTTLRIRLNECVATPDRPDSWNTFGPATRRQYAAWQRACGYLGDAVDGVPDELTLTKIGLTVQP